MAHSCAKLSQLTNQAFVGPFAQRCVGCHVDSEGYTLTIISLRPKNRDDADGTPVATGGDMKHLLVVEQSMGAA